MFFEEPNQLRTGGSVGWVSGCHAGDREFDLSPDQHLGSQNN